MTTIVSIITPVYKTPAGLLHRFLTSVLRQTISDIELIAVNDASPDHCPRILDETALKDPRMRVVHRSVNGRAGMSRNDGLDLATGRYVHFADADDVLQPDMCEVLTTLADRCGADVVWDSFMSSDPEGKHLSRRILSDRVLDLKQPAHRAIAYHDLTFALWNKLFRKEVIAPLRFEQFEANVGEDVLFNVSVLCRSRKIATTSYAGYDYTLHPASATGRKVKGMAYLEALADSGNRIRETIEGNDGSRVGKRFADMIDLKRFVTGCKWISENPDPRQRDELWRYWRRHFGDDLYPRIHSRKVLAAWTRGAVVLGSARRAQLLIWGACRAADRFYRVRQIWWKPR